jgi:hypothetical protein
MLFITRVIYEHGDPRWNDIDKGIVHQQSLAILLAQPFSSKVGGTWRSKC